jgi:hypothetical protein
VEDSTVLTSVGTDEGLAALPVPGVDELLPEAEAVLVLATPVAVDVGTVVGVEVGTALGACVGAELVLCGDTVATTVGDDEPTHNRLCDFSFDKVVSTRIVLTPSRCWLVSNGP